MREETQSTTKQKMSLICNQLDESQEGSIIGLLDNPIKIGGEEFSRTLALIKNDTLYGLSLYNVYTISPNIYEAIRNNKEALDKMNNAFCLPIKNKIIEHIMSTVGCAYCENDDERTIILTHGERHVYEVYYYSYPNGNIYIVVSCFQRSSYKGKLPQKADESSSDAPTFGLG